MCGVCGIVDPRLGIDSRPGADLSSGAHPGGGADFRPASTNGISASRIDAMVEALTHRGPDDLAVEQAPGAVLGATRLAIRGLRDGRQPIRDAESGVVVVCNGEIDNSPELRRLLKERGREVTQKTDVAVLPGLYLEFGEEFVDRLIGAFAIAVWDPRSARLVLARDRAGERPLFYHHQGEVIRFATEISALATDPELRLTTDRTALAGYLRFGSFSSPATPFAEIRKVAPGQIVTFEGGGARARSYWRWSIATSAKATPTVDAFDQIFRRAVARQSEVEVDFGVFLSGGVDSSYVAAVLKSIRPEHPLRAYTLRFGDASYDEGDFATEVAKHLGIEQVPVWVRPDSFPQEIAELVRLVGEPLADPAWVPTALLARRAAQDVKVALVGEGADELFGGYPTYLGARAAERYARLPGMLKKPVRRLVEAWPPSDKKVTLSFLLKRFVAGAELDGIARHHLWTSTIPPALLRRLGVEESGMTERGPALSPAAAELAAGPEDADLLDLVQRIDLETSLAEGLLTKADRASMQSALELRAPFLDREVMDFAATLPPGARVHGLTTKVFLKKAALRYLPPRIVHRKKRGLSVPLAGWIRGPLRDWAESRLSDRLLEEAGVNPSTALELFAEHLSRKADHARALWTLIVLSEWLRWTHQR
jgi:asparagine synthase (glutamine-hydrolysing)